MTPICRRHLSHIRPLFTGSLWLVQFVIVMIFRPHCSIMYTDAACCYRPSTMVCLSVSVVSPSKMAEPIELLFGLWTLVAKGSIIRWMHTGATWRIALKRPCAVAMRPFCQITLSAFCCYYWFFSGPGRVVGLLDNKFKTKWPLTKIFGKLVQLDII